MIQEKERQKKIAEFIIWFKKNCRGKERAEGQIFFDRFLQAFGNAGALEAGARFEDPVKKKTGKTGFVDLIWPSRVVIELKERGTNLKKHYHQAEEYWIRLVPNRPPYMILCNFDEFWVYDLNTQLNDPVHILKTEDLEKEFTALSFLFSEPEKPFFNNNNVEVTEEAAMVLGKMYLSLQQRKVDPEKAQRFILQLVVALFSEDVGLIPKATLQKILGEAVGEPIVQKELFELFTAMASESASQRPKQYKTIPYFNGGLFNKVEAFELKFNELDLLADASKYDWSKVRPSIFGSIFEASMDQNARHDRGAHFTSELDIQKIVGPTIVKPFVRRIEKAKSKKDLADVLKAIRDFTVLDPACGSGNFLYIAFRELRRLEIDVLERISEKEKSKQVKMSLVSPNNFYGIDINGFGLELAKVALCIGRKLSADEFETSDNVLPFVNLDKNFINEDALFIQWPKADAIIGNPPFLGSRKMRDSGFKDEYVEGLWSLYPKSTFPRNADYCCYWFRKAHDSSANFIGLVGSNSISQNESRKASLDYIINNNGTIHNAISTQVWSGAAKVHVSIVNWYKGSWAESKLLDSKEVDQINSSLKNEFDVTKAKKLNSNLNICFQGVVPVGQFEITPEIYKEWVNADHKNREVLKVFFSGNELTEYPDYRGQKYIVDFNDKSLEAASLYRLPFEHVKTLVKPQRSKVRRKAHKEKWWQYGDKRPAMRAAVANLSKFIAMPGHSKWYIPVLVPSDWLPYVNSSFAIASEDFYLLGILTSKLHRDWVKAQSSTLKGDTRYTNTTCFETFPFLWDTNDKNKNKVCAIMKELDSVRSKIMAKNGYGITKLYNDFLAEPKSQITQLHAELDKIVCEDVYGWEYDPAKNYNPELFALNEKLFNEQEKIDKKKSTKKQIKPKK